MITTYKTGDQISMNLAPNEAIPAGSAMMATVYNKDTGVVKAYSTSPYTGVGTISKINDLLYNITVTPSESLAMGVGEYSLELALYTITSTPPTNFVTISVNEACFNIANSETGRQILK